MASLTNTSATTGSMIFPERPPGSAQAFLPTAVPSGGVGDWQPRQPCPAETTGLQRGDLDSSVCFAPLKCLLGPEHQHLCDATSCTVIV